MIRIARHKVRHIIYSALGSIALSVGMYSCANIGRPDGGVYDELPPKFVKSTPLQGALNNTKKKIVIEFDEFIKLEKASEKVVVSPPQIQAPEIKPSGKKVTVSLQDTLKPNTTYTIDFSDAIVDNNEDNPLGNFTFAFSTGGVIDTMEVAGILLDASNLEPVKGMLMGLHSNLSDSAFTKLPLDRVSRTDSRGKFSIRGVAPGSYRLYGLMDANQNFAFDQKSEAIAFNDSLIIPSFEERVRQDTIWKDTLTIDTIIEKQFTYYLPDHVVMRSFVEDATTQYFVKNERPTPQKFSFYFSAPADTLPTIRGFNFDAKDAFLIEKSLKNDTIHYWIKDSLLYKTDTLNMAVDYLYTDTLGMLVPKTDTLLLASKMIKAPIKAKKKKKSEDPEPTIFLKTTVDAPSSMDLYRNVSLEFEEPIAYFDSSAIHLEIKVDTLWKETPFLFRRDSTKLRRYELLAEWKPESEYRFTVDSTAFHGWYGLVSDKISQQMKVRSLNDYSALFMKVAGADSSYMVELMDAQDKVIRREQVIDGEADFFYLNPGKYYARLFIDTNRNGVWDTGLYSQKRQPETVYYYPQVMELKAMWEVAQDWNLQAVPADKQKPEELKKQKPDEIKKKKHDRDRQNY